MAYPVQEYRKLLPCSDTFCMRQATIDLKLEEQLGEDMCRQAKLIMHPSRVAVQQLLQPLLS